MLLILCGECGLQMENLCFFCENKNIETELIKSPGVLEIEFLHFHISVVCLLSLTRVRLCRISIRHIRTRVLKMQTPGYAENSRIQFPARPALLAALRKE